MHRRIGIKKRKNKRKGITKRIPKWMSVFLSRFCAGEAIGITQREREREALSNCPIKNRCGRLAGARKEAKLKARLLSSGSFSQCIGLVQLTCDYNVPVASEAWKECGTRRRRTHRKSENNKCTTCSRKSCGNKTLKNTSSREQLKTPISR